MCSKNASARPRLVQEEPGRPRPSSVKSCRSPPLAGGVAAAGNMPSNRRRTVVFKLLSQRHLGSSGIILSQYTLGRTKRCLRRRVNLLFLKTWNDSLPSTTPHLHGNPRGPVSQTVAVPFKTDWEKLGPVINRRKKKSPAFQRLSRRIRHNLPWTGLYVLQPGSMHTAALSNFALGRDGTSPKPVLLSVRRYRSKTLGNACSESRIWFFQQRGLWSAHNRIGPGLHCFSPPP